MFPAKGGIALVAAELHLLTLCDHLSVQDTGIEVRPLTAPADCLDLLYVVGKLHQALRTGEKLASEICAQAVADDGYIMLIHQIT